MSLSGGLLLSVVLAASAVFADEIHQTPAGIWAPFVAGDVVAEKVAELPAGVGNIAFSPSGGIIYSHHPFYGNSIKVAKMDEDGKNFTPYPSAE